MSFTNANWGCVSGSLSQGQKLVAGVILNSPNLFTYASPTDTVAQISASNYFLPMQASLSEGDIIFGSGSDGNFGLKVTDVSPTSVTVISMFGSIGMLGTMAYQNANNVNITGGTVSVPFIYAEISGDEDILPSNSLTAFEFTNPNISLSDDLGLANFTNGMTFSLKNTSSGDVSFIPFSGETIDGAASLTLGPQQGVLITKDPTQWSTVSTNASLPSLPFIVGPEGPYTTIQSAIDAAAPLANAIDIQVVLINAGSYTEDLNLAPFVYLASAGGTSENAVTVLGSAVFTPLNDNDVFSTSAVTFKSNGVGAAFSVQGTNICVCHFNNTIFNGDTSTAFECINDSAEINHSAVQVMASSGEKSFNMTGGNLTSVGSFGTNTDTPSTLSGTSNLLMISGFHQNAFVLTDSASAAFTSATFVAPNNLSFLTIGPSAQGTIFASTVISGAPSGYYVTGTGNFIYNSVMSIQGSASQIDPALVTAGQELQVGTLSFDGGVTSIDTTGQMIFGRTGLPVLIAPLSGDGTVDATGALTVTGINGTPISLPLSLTNGGTNASLTASLGGIFYSTATAGAILAGTATAGQLLRSGASAAPTWSTSTYPATNAINTLLYASAANVMSALATANNGVLVTSAGGVPSISSTLPAGLTIPGYGLSNWVNQTTASVTMATNTGYTANAGASLITFTLPTTSAVGDFVEINGKDAGLFTIAQATGQQIFVAGTNTISGAGGSLTSTSAHDSIRLRCITANTIFDVVSMTSLGFTIV